jgi:hypothetical protein
MEVVTRQALTAPARTATARRAATKAARSAGPRSPLALGLLIALFARDRKVLATLLAVLYLASARYWFAHSRTALGQR